MHEDFLETCLKGRTRQVWSWEEAPRSVSWRQAKTRPRSRQIVKPMSISTCSSIQRWWWWLPHVHTWITWIVRRWCFTPQRRLLRMNALESKRLNGAEGGRTTSCRWWGACTQDTETETNNEFGDETNWRLVESGTSAKLVATSDRSRCKPGASYQCGKAWFVNVMTDWKSNSSRIHRGKERCQGMNTSIQMSDGKCLMNVRMKSRIWPDNRGLLFNCRSECRRHSGTMPCETRNVSWRLYTMLCKTSRFRGWRTWCWTCRGDDASQCWTCCIEEGELVTHAASEDWWRMQQTTPRRPCVLYFVGLDQVDERLMMRCHHFCGGAADFVHRQSSGYPGCAREMVVPILWGAVCVFLKRVTSESWSSRFWEEVDTDVWNPGTNSENASERLYSKFESVGTPAHKNVQGPNDGLEPGRNVWHAVESDCLASRVTRCSVCLKAECTSYRIANFTSSCLISSCFFSSFPSSFLVVLSFSFFKNSLISVTFFLRFSFFVVYVFLLSTFSSLCFIFFFFFFCLNCFLILFPSLFFLFVLETDQIFVYFCCSFWTFFFLLLSFFGNSFSSFVLSFCVYIQKPQKRDSFENVGDCQQEIWKTWVFEVFSKQTKVNAQFLRRSEKSKNENEKDDERTIFWDFFNQGEIQKTLFWWIKRRIFFGGKGYFLKEPDWKR